MHSLRYTHILFDWDGTLVDSLPLWVEHFHIALQQLGKSVSDREAAGMLLNEVDPYERLRVSPFELRAADQKAMLKTQVQSKLIDVSLNPHVLETLQSLLSSGCKLGIVSNSFTEQHIVPVLKKHELEPYFKVIIGGADVTHAKPDPEGIHKALLRLGAYPEEVLMVGDSEKDVHAAHNAEIACALYYPPHNERFYSPEFIQALDADYLIHSFQDLPAIAVQ